MQDHFSSFFWLLNRTKITALLLVNLRYLVTRRALGTVERIYLRQRCSDASVNKTIVKPRLAVAARRDFLDVKFRVAAATIAEKAIRFRHPDYDQDRVQKLSQFVHVPTSIDTQHFIETHARVFA